MAGQGAPGRCANALLTALAAPRGGAAFDRLSLHQQAVDRVRSYADAGGNARLQHWAAGALPVLHGHLQMAMPLQQATQG